MATEGIEVRSVGNTLTLHSTALIEAFNLKAAIEYHLGNCKKYTKVQTLSLKENLKKKNLLLLTYSLLIGSQSNNKQFYKIRLRSLHLKRYR